jgi:ABC-type bacteriocin/lantibiotic exporter with double-glycine peptidase domain
LKALDAARRLGFTKSAKYTLSLDELATRVRAGHFPIVFVDLRHIDAVKGTHALVVVGLSRTAVNVYDPAQGKRSLSRDTFSVAWAMQHHLAIIIER